MVIANANTIHTDTTDTYIYVIWTSWNASYWPKVLAGGKYYTAYVDGAQTVSPETLNSIVDGEKLATGQYEASDGRTYYAEKYKLKIDCGIPEHVHNSDSCYSCGRTDHAHDTADCFVCAKVAHTHTEDCKLLLQHVEFVEADQDVLIEGDGSTVVNVYYEYKMYTIRYVYARCKMDGTDPTYQIADWTGWGSLEDCTWKNIGSSADVLPDFTDPSGATERSSFTHTDGNIYYYISLKAKYGATILDSWPSANIGDVQYDGWTYKFGSWAAAPGTEYREISELNANVVGPYQLMSSEMIVENPELLEDGSYLAQNMVAWWNATGVIGTHTYHNYFEVSALPDGYTDAGKMIIYGIEYPRYEYSDGTTTKTYVKYGEKFYELDNEVFAAAHNADTRVDPVKIAGYYVINDDPVKQTSSNNYKNTDGDGNKTCSLCGADCDFCNTFFYDRNRHYIKFWNHTGYLEDGRGSPWYYGASLAPIGKYLTDTFMAAHYPSTLEPGAYVFEGWYTTPGCLEGTKVDWGTMTMPDADFVVYANWVPRTWTVRFYALETDVGGANTYHASASVTHNQVMENNQRPSANPTREGYTFVGWFYYNDRGVKMAFNISSMPVQQDMDLFAEWSSTTSVTYTVRYVYEDVNGVKIEIAAPTTGYLFAGATKTFSAKTGAQLYGEYQTGYYPDKSSVSILMVEESANNTATFFYQQKASVSYTVKYVDSATGKELQTAKTEENITSAIVTEFAEPLTVDGKTYLPENYAKRLVLSANEAENVITFYYVKADTTGAYVIRYYLENLTGDGYVEQTDYVYGTAENGTEIKASDYRKEFTGFTWDGNDDIATVVTGEIKELKLYYTRNSYSYSIRYEVKDTGALLKEETGPEGKYGTTVTESDPESVLTVSGIQYSLTDTTTTKSIVIGTDKAENVITFYYEPTKTVLQITNDGVDGNDTVLYRIVGPTELSGSNNCITLYVAVNGDDTAVIGEADGSVGLYAGTYEVTPLTDWSYRYSLSDVDQGTQEGTSQTYSILLTETKAYTMTFHYTDIGSDWLGGEVYCENEMEKSS